MFNQLDKPQAGETIAIMLMELIPMQEIPPIVKANGMSGVSNGLNCPSATNAKAVPRQIDNQMPA